MPAFHKGNRKPAIRSSRNRKYWALMSAGFPKRIVALAEATGGDETEQVAAYMMRASETADGSYVDPLTEDWGDVDPDDFWRNFVESGESTQESAAQRAADRQAPSTG